MDSDAWAVVRGVLITVVVLTIVGSAIYLLMSKTREQWTRRRSEERAARAARKALREQETRPAED